MDFLVSKASLSVYAYNSEQDTTIRVSPPPNESMEKSGYMRLSLTLSQSFLPSSF